MSIKCLIKPQSSTQSDINLKNANKLVHTSLLRDFPNPRKNRNRVDQPKHTRTSKCKSIWLCNKISMFKIQMSHISRLIFWISDFIKFKPCHPTATNNLKSKINTYSCDNKNYFLNRQVSSNTTHWNYLKKGGRLCQSDAKSFSIKMKKWCCNRCPLKMKTIDFKTPQRSVISAVPNNL